MNQQRSFLNFLELPGAARLQPQPRLDAPPAPIETKRPVAPPRGMERALVEYLNECRLRGLDPKTVKLYDRYLSQWIEYAPDGGNAATFRAFLVDRPWNDRTRSIVLRSVRTFLLWNIRQGYLPNHNWMRDIGIKLKKKAPPQVLTLAEVNSILAAIPGSPAGLRDRAIIGCLFFAAARRNEVITIRRKDINWGSGLVPIVGKGGKADFLYLCKPALQLVQEWLRVAPKSEWLFCSMRIPEKHVDPSQLTHGIGRYARRAGIGRRVCLHLLRHSSATALLEAGVPLEIISQILRHSDLKTSLIYTQISQKKRIEAASEVFDQVEVAGPRKGWRRRQTIEAGGQ